LKESFSADGEWWIPTGQRLRSAPPQPRDHVPVTSQTTRNNGDNETGRIMHLMKTQQFGKFIRFDPAEIATWLDRGRVAG
jgi:hypothetical protein